LALSSISSEEIWSKSGRLEKAGSEVIDSLQFDVISDFKLAVSVQGQEGREIPPLPDTRRRDYLPGVKCCEIVQRAPDSSLSNMLVLRSIFLPLCSS
jgi:hypothetical protein